jgi:hypothetical protein
VGNGAQLGENKMRVLTATFIEFGEFVKEDDRFQLSIVSGNHEIVEMTDKELDEYMGDWIDLDSYKGAIVFAKHLDEVHA